MHKLFSLITPLFLFISILFASDTANGKTFHNFGLSAEDFANQKNLVLASLDSLLTHANNGDFSYKNELGAIKQLDRNTPEASNIVIYHHEDVQFLFFLGYLSDIDLEIGHRLVLQNVVSYKALKRLSDFYRSISQQDLYPYWMIYNLFGLVATKLTGNPLWMQIILDSNVNDVDAALNEYVKTHPGDTFSNDILLCKSIESMDNILSGILTNKK